MLKLYTDFKVIKYMLIIYFLYSFQFSISADPIINKLYVPEGFEISIYADNLDSPRQLTETGDGFIIVGSKNGDKIFALNDTNYDGAAEEKILLANGLQNPTGVSFYKGDLYFSEIDKVWIIEDIDSWLSSDQENLPKRRIFMDDLPS